MSIPSSVIHPHNSEHCPHCQALADLRKTVLDFTGRVYKAQTFEEFQKASKGLYSETKRIKINGDTES